MGNEPIYVEIRIHGGMEELWRSTQVPELHQQWDLRFSEIKYLPRPDESQPQRFLYSTRIGFGLAVNGEGESVGAKETDQSRTSSLKFSSDDPKSPIRHGAGYWQYIPTPDGIRFLTQYDYQTRFGWAGRVFDRWVFRPLIGWATAWSFDRLRLWVEQGIDPKTSALNALVHAIARVSLGLIWIYQGIVPKLLFPDSGEREILAGSGVFPGHESLVLQALGIGEIVFGLCLLLLWRSRSLFVVNAVLMVVLALGAGLSQPRALVAPFNPLTFNLALFALSAVGYLVSTRMPTARTCLRQRPREK